MSAGGVKGSPRLKDQELVGGYNEPSERIISRALADCARSGITDD